MPFHGGNHQEWRARRRQLGVDSWCWAGSVLVLDPSRCARQVSAVGDLGPDGATLLSGDLGFGNLLDLSEPVYLHQ